MDVPTRAPAVLEQLPLPLELPLPDAPAAPSSPLLTPTQIWSTLPPALRQQCRQILVQILQEVVHDALRS